MNQPFSIIANDGQGGKYARIANSQVDLLLMLQEALQQGMTSIEIKTGDRYESDMNQNVLQIRDSQTLKWEDAEEFSSLDDGMRALREPGELDARLVLRRESAAGEPGTLGGRRWSIQTRRRMNANFYFENNDALRDGGSGNTFQSRGTVTWDTERRQWRATIIVQRDPEIRFDAWSDFQNAAVLMALSQHAACPLIPAPESTAPEPSAARLAINLMRVLDWKNPGGTIREAYIPGFLKDKCDEAIRLVPMDELRAEYERHSTLYPEGLVERWLRDSSQ